MTLGEATVRYCKERTVVPNLVPSPQSVPGWYELCLFRAGLCCNLTECSFSLRHSLSTLGRISLPFCNATRCLTLSIDPDVDRSGFRRADSGSNRSGIPVNDSEQSASRRFWGPPPALPVLNGIRAEPKRVRESGLCHAKSIADRSHVNFLRHMCPESFFASQQEKPQRH